MKSAVFLLYGIPRGTAATDQSYRAYFRAGMEALHLCAYAPVYFAGGATDPSRPRLTEATTALEAFTSLELDQARFPVTAIPHGLDCREALQAVAAVLSEEATEITVFCAWTHKDHTQYLARRILNAGGNRRIIVIGLVFPFNINPGAMALGRLLRLPRAAIGILAWHSKTIRYVERCLRLWYMRRHAAYPDQLPSII